MWYIICTTAPVGKYLVGIFLQKMERFDDDLPFRLRGMTRQEFEEERNNMYVEKIPSDNESFVDYVSEEENVNQTHQIMLSESEDSEDEIPLHIEGKYETFRITQILSTFMGKN